MRLYPQILMTIWASFALSTAIFAQQQPLDFSKVMIDLPAKKMQAMYISETIWAQAEMQLFFNNEQLDCMDWIKVGPKKKISLEELLQKMLLPRNLYYEAYPGGVSMKGRYTIIVIKSKEDESDGTSGNNHHPQIEYTGRVTNSHDEPLEYANVVVKGRSVGAKTDKDGYFNFYYDKVRAKLIASCVGFKSQQVIANGEDMEIQLDSATSQMDEVMVIGYGKSSKRFSTGSINRVDGSELAVQPVGNIAAALEGMVAGFSITQLSGVPGSNFKMELRGRNSIGSGNMPLFIVDGLPIQQRSQSWDLNANTGPTFQPYNAAGLGANMSASPLNIINIADIESVTVLKDADATAIYGSQGANGVVLITTKTVKNKIPLSSDISFYSGVGRVEHMVSYLDTRQYLAMRREAFKNDGLQPAVTDHDVNGSWDTTRYTDWQRQMIGGTAPVSEGQLMLKCGGDIVKAMVSGNYRREYTVYPGKYAYSKGGIRANIGFNSEDHRFKLPLFFNYVGDDNKLPATDLTALSNTPPNAPAVYTAEGDLNWKDGFDNPFANLLRNYTATTTNMTVSLVPSYALRPWLQIRANLGTSRQTLTERQINPVKSLNPNYGPASGYSYFGNSLVSHLIIEPQLSIDTTFGMNAFSIVLGGSFQQENQERTLILGTGYAGDTFIDYPYGAGLLTTTGQYINDYRYRAYFSRISFNRDRKYLLNLTGRRDGSSRFGPERRYANFWAAGAGWIFSEEKWCSHLPWLSFGKLRATFGVTGNDQVKDYSNFYHRATDPANPLFPDLIANPDYTWEKVNKKELGLDLGFVNDRLLISASYYRNQTSNMLLEMPYPGSTTLHQIKNVDAVVENRGLELEVSATIFKNQDLTWKVNANYSWPTNTLTRFPDNLNSSYKYFYTVGHSINNVKGFTYQGIDPQTGVYQFRDINGDDKITLADFTNNTLMGTISFGALSQHLTYHGLEVDLLLQYVHQNGYSYLYSPQTPGPGSMLNQPQSVMDRWQKPGDRAAIQQFTQQLQGIVHNAFVYSLNSDHIIGDNSFLRVKNLSIQYHLPAAWGRRLSIKGATIQLSGQNLWTITRYPGRNPETTYSSSDIYPPLRIWTAGVKLNL